MPDRLLKDYEAVLRDAGCSAKVIAHSRVVRDCACDYARHNPDADFDLVEEGAMLHDIGRSKTHSIRHAQEGADLLRSMGYREKTARIAECHTGAGLTPDECTLLGLSPRDCVPRTTEEKIVTHADNRVSGLVLVSIYDTISSAVHLPKKIRRRMYRLGLEVELLCS